MGIILALNEQTQVVSHNCILLIYTTFSGWGMLLAGLGNKKNAADKFWPVLKDTFRCLL